MDTTRAMELLKKAYFEFFGEAASWLLYGSLMRLALAVVVAGVTIYVPRVLPKPTGREEDKSAEEEGRIRIRDRFD